MKRTRVVIADDHRILRQGIRSLLESDGAIEILAEAGDGQDAFEETLLAKPDLLIMDLQMPRLHGLEVIKRLRKLDSDTAIIVLTMHAKPYVVQQALAAGAQGYVLKDEAVGELRTAIAAVLAGGVFISAALRDAVHAESEPPILSGREKEVLLFIAKGSTTRQIADQLFLSPKTVESHRQNIMKKLGMYSVAELTQYSINLGLIEN